MYAARQGDDNAMDVLLSTLLPGRSEMAGRMHALDWAATDLGSPSAWPSKLLTSLSLCLASRFPILLWWGPRHVMLYNDAYIPFLGGTKHPQALARPGVECWGEIWDTIGPMLDGVLRTGDPVWFEDFPFFVARRLPREEVYVTFTYSPIFAPDGITVQGIFCPCIETTQRVVATRRLDTLHRLGAHASHALDVPAACDAMARVLSRDDRDIPFAAIYLVADDQRHARLGLVAGLGGGGAPPFPPVATTDSAGSDPWRLRDVLRSSQACRSENLVDAGLRLPGGPWPEPALLAVALPVPAAAHDGLAVLAVLGVSPRQPLDAAYEAFQWLVAGHIGTAIAGAQAHEAERLEVVLRASEGRFRRYFDLGLIGMALTSPTMGILEVNDELCRILGYTREELLARHWVDLTHPDDRAADVAQFERVMAGEIEGYVLDKRWYRKDGRMIHSTMAANCLRTSDGSVDCFVGLVLDTTARIEADDALHQARDQLAQVSRVAAMGELAASIAHEVNQPLAAVVANGHAAARWLEALPPNLEEAGLAVARVVSDGLRAGQVLDRIRGLWRSDEARTWVDLRRVLREVAAIVEDEARRRGVRLGVGSSHEAATVLADPVQIQQVVLNLVMNGFEAMDTVPPSRRTLELRLDHHGGQAWRVSVRDAGIGLQPNERDRVFDAFYTTKASGMGIGLAISRSIVQRHGGRLWCTANDVGGETFSFTLQA